MTEDHVRDEPNIGLLCFIVYRAMEARVLAGLAAAGFGDTTAAQGRVFARIDPDGTRLTDLAERALITKQTAGFLVDQLERAGYVRRVPDPRDARARLLKIMDAEAHNGFCLIQRIERVLTPIVGGADNHTLRKLGFAQRGEE